MTAMVIVVYGTVVILHVCYGHHFYEDGEDGHDDGDDAKQNCDYDVCVYGDEFDGEGANSYDDECSIRATMYMLHVIAHTVVIMHMHVRLHCRM